MTGDEDIIIRADGTIACGEHRERIVAPAPQPQPVAAEVTDAVVDALCTAALGAQVALGMSKQDAFAAIDKACRLWLEETAAWRRGPQRQPGEGLGPDWQAGPA